MVRGRVSLPATRDPLRHVDSARGGRSGALACADAPVHGGLRGGLPGRRAAVDDARRDVRRPVLSGISDPPAAPASAWASGGGRRRQRALASRASTATLVVCTSSRAAAGLPAALQPRSESHGARLEVDTPPLHTHTYFETLDQLVGVVQQQFARWFHPNLQLHRLCAIH